MTRQETNLEIAKLLKGTKISPISLELKYFSKEFPEQRAGQLLCNYICYDYRDKEPSELTKKVLDYLFPGNPDPFYEESEVTLNRLKEKLTFKTN